MGIYRVKYQTKIPVGSGGRITIPQEMREDLGLDDGDELIDVELTDGDDEIFLTSRQGNSILPGVGYW